MADSQIPANSGDGEDDELLQALAAFGDGAMDLFNDVDEDVAGESPEKSDHLDSPTVAAEQEPGSETAVSVDREFKLQQIEDSDSELIRYSKELANAIYSSSSPVDTADRCIVFLVEQQTFAIPLNHTREILRSPRITELPRTPTWLRGVINVRGQIVSVTDLRTLANLPGHPPELQAKAIVVHSDDKNITTSIIADRILGIRTLEENPNPNPKPKPSPQTKPEQCVAELPAEVAAIARSVIQSEDTKVTVLDIEKVLEAAEFAAI